MFLRFADNQLQYSFEETGHFEPVEENTKFVATAGDAVEWRCIDDSLKLVCISMFTNANDDIVCSGTPVPQGVRNNYNMKCWIGQTKSKISVPEKEEYGITYVSSNGQAGFIDPSIELNPDSDDN